MWTASAALPEAGREKVTRPGVRPKLLIGGEIAADRCLGSAEHTREMKTEFCQGEPGQVPGKRRYRPNGLGLEGNFSVF